MRNIACWSTCNWVSSRERINMSLTRVAEMGVMPAMIDRFELLEGDCGQFSRARGKRGSRLRPFVQLKREPSGAVAYLVSWPTVFDGPARAVEFR